ncbi:MAG TPA: caspase family protein [Thermodesulfovibrionales bacterium]|nr:caspase family protein [Thermodesulfovibrionales bacterium]
MNIVKNSLWLLVVLFAFVLVDDISVYGQQSPVSEQHVENINDLLRQNGVPNGFAAFDSFGRVELKGAYADEREVDRAFSLAQTVVGIRWVSPVTPENIKVKEWERRLGNIFSRAKVLKPDIKGDASPGPIRNRYALVVGVGNFKYGKSPSNPKGIQQLQFAVRDATSFYQFLADPQRGGFRRENIFFLADQQATRKNIGDALNQLSRTAEPDDLVTVYISSHGTPPDKFGGVFIVAYDTEVIPRENVWHTAVSETMLKDFVENLRAKRLVMILDACYSNGAYKGVPGFLPPGGKSLGAGDDEGHGISREYGKRLLGAKDIVLEEPAAKPKARAKSAGDADSDGWGKVLIGASGSGEQSWESDKLNNSIFTYYFIDGLKRYNGSVKNAFIYSKPLVYQRVKEEKGRDIDQNPQVLATNSNWDMRLAKK